MTRHFLKRRYDKPLLIAVVMVFGGTSLLANRYGESQRLNAEYSVDEKLSRSLDQERLALLQYTAFKRLTVDELAAGQITLKEATDRFLATDADWIKTMKQLKGSSDSEREARCAIYLACTRKSDPVERRSLFDRLDIEFAILFPGAERLAKSTKPDEGFFNLLNR